MNPLRILVNGAHGRMGQTVIACAKNDPAVSVAAEIDMGDDFDAALGGCDAVIDFSHHSTTEKIAAACAQNQKLLVIGTTGHGDAQVANIRRAASQIPIVFAPNFS